LRVHACKTGQTGAIASGVRRAIIPAPMTAIPFSAILRALPSTSTGGDFQRGCDRDWRLPDLLDRL